MGPGLGGIVVGVALGVLGCTHEPTGPPPLPAVADTLFGADATLWFVTDTLGGGLMRPAVDAERVYFGRGDFKSRAEMTARDRATGALLWHQPFTIATNAALAGNNVGIVGGALRLFDRQTGAVVRQYAPPNDGTTGNVATDGTRFYVGSYYGQLSAVDASSGDEVWRTPLATNTGTYAQGVAVAGEHVAVTLTYSPPIGNPVDSGIVAVLDRATGSLLWRVSRAGATESAAFVDPPAIAGNVVVVVTLRHQVHAYDLALGREVWSYDASRSALQIASWGIAACDGAIIISDGNMGLVSLDAASGAVQWTLPDLQIGSLSWIECSYGTVMALSAGILEVFDARTGTLLHRVPGSERSEIFVASAGRDANAVYVATERGFGAFRLP